MAKLRINRRIIFFIMLLIPFFEPLSLDMLIAKDVAPLCVSGITFMFSISRILISAFAIADYLYYKRVPAAITSRGIILYCISCVIVSLVNGSLYFRFIFGIATYIGFIFLCEKLMSVSVNDFYKSCMLLFGLLSMIGAITIFIMPYGFLNAESKADAIYFFGSKNSAFYYFITFIYFFFYRALKKRGHLPKLGGMTIAVLVLAVIVCDSSNSLLCLLVVGVYYIIFKYALHLYKCINIKLLFIIWVFLTVFIIFFASHPAMQKIVSMVGRNTSYSGRDYLWEQAINMFLDHPFIGNGNFVEFQLRSGTQAVHAHSVYLDTIAKYGVLPLAFLLGTVVLIINKISKQKIQKYASLAGIVLFAILLHSVFDALSIYFIVLLFLSIENMQGDSNKKNIGTMGFKRKYIWTNYISD